MTGSEAARKRDPLHVLLAARAQCAPHRVAVEFDGRSLTYEQLDRRSNQFARVLQDRGVGPGVLAGLLVDRSLEMVVALLAILKAGGAYVPLDIKQGNYRIQQILDEARIEILVADANLLNGLEKFPSEIVYVGHSEKWTDGFSFDAVETKVRSSDLAYVIFTSGSTGEPKGVEIEHGSLVNLLESMLHEPGFDVSDTLLAVTTIAFDIAGLELYLPLLAGGRLVIANREAASDGKLLTESIARSNVSMMQATPVTWRLLLECGWSGKRGFKALVGGEALSPELGRRLVARCGQVWNMYGPTETTIWSSVYRVRGDEEVVVPIGKPIANTTLHILGIDGTPVAPGQEGELYIGGDGLARGYFGRSDLTAERFVPDPFRPVSGGRLYRTGDIARYRPDGNVEFLGRTDHQVKIRGFRIELGEIESVLEQHPHVRQAVAVARENSASEKHIIAYFVSAASAPAPIAQLRQHLSERLPDYMLPSALIEVAEFPLTANGKVDRKALPAPRASDIAAGQEFVAPRNETEQKLASLWEEVLQVRPIGVTASFFDLGGRSLQAARLFMKIGRSFRKDLPVSDLLFAATIERLAEQLRSESDTASYRTLVPIREHGSRRSFFCVHGGHGSTLFLRNLANELPSEQPFYGIEPEGLDGKRIERTTIQLMAAHYLSEIRKVQPSGPYLLGGYCFGGLVAFEMAQQIRRAGEETALLALFSAPLRFNRRTDANVPPSRSEGARIATLIHSPRTVLTGHWGRFKSSLRSRAQMRACEFFLQLGGTVPQFLRTLYVGHTLFRAELDYVPELYPGTVDLFYGPGLWDNDPGMGWNGLSDRLEQHLIGKTQTRSRREIMNPPLVQLLARELTGILEKRLYAVERGLPHRNRAFDERKVLRIGS